MKRKSMMIYSADAENFKGRSNSAYYFGAVLGGVALFVILLFVFKATALLIKWIILYWVIILIGIGTLIVLRKIFGKKKVTVVRE